MKKINQQDISCTKNKIYNIMRLSVFLLIVFVLSVSADSYSQTYRLSIDKNNVTIADVFRDIEAKSEFSFLYSPREIDVNQQVSYQGSNELITEILASILADKDIAYRITDKHIILYKQDQFFEKNDLILQGIAITGTVTDADGQPLPGASVSIKGTSQGTTTDANGVYSLIVPDVNSTLVFSYIGFVSQEFLVGTQRTIQVSLREVATELDEIVVVGYGTVKKRDLTGAVASVNSEKITSTSAINAAQALQGWVSGVLVNNTSSQPGASPSVYIRGKRSISASSDPLYVVDGIPMAGGLSDLSPIDIESIDVLKDASATAIYGARGSNGVIMITTKRGKDGKTIVDYNGYYGAQTILNQLRYMNGAEYAETVREAYRSNNRYPFDTPNFEEDQKLTSFRDPYTLESLRMAYDANGNYDPSKVRSDSKWWDAVHRTGTVTNHQVSIRGGTAKTQFLISGNYYKDVGIMKDEDFSRYSIRMSLDHEISKWFKIGGMTTFTHSLQNRGSNLSDSWRVMPMGRFYDDDGTLLVRVSGTDDQWFNPLQRLVEGAVSIPLKTNRFMGSYYGEIKLPVDGLRFRSNLGLDFRSIQDYEFRSAQSRNTTMNYAKNAAQDIFSYTWENLLFYDKTFGDHTIGVTALQSIQQYLSESNNIPVQNTPSDALLWYDVASGLVPGAISSSKSQWNLASFMGRINYNFKGKYLLTLSARYDGASRLAPGHQWVLFPAASLAWRMNEESFLQDISVINNLKLRLGYGTSASSEVSPYDTKGTLSTKYYNYGTLTRIGYAPNTMPNNTLTWETTGQWNLGIDFGILKNRLSGTIDAYVQNTTDLLLDRQLPVVSGFSVIKSNIGNTRNKGIELNLNSVNISRKDFSWTTNLMLYANKEEIVELYNGKQDDPGNSWFIGEAINVFYDYKKVGIWQNTPEDLSEMAKFNANGSNFKPGAIKLYDNGDYVINSDDRVIQGQARPKMIGSLNNTFTYKGFDLNFFFLGSYGSMIKNSISYLNQAHRNGNVKVNYWTPNNPTNDFPRPIEGVDFLDYYETLHYEKADFLRLRFVTFGYTIPKHLGQKLELTRCRIYAQVQNPLIWTNYTGVDPEGASGYTRPSVTSWIVGLNLSF